MCLLCHFPSARVRCEIESAAPASAQDKRSQKRACVSERVRLSAHTYRKRIEKIFKWVYNSSLEAQLTAWKAVKIKIYPLHFQRVPNGS